VTVIVPLSVLNQLPRDAFDWLVPGWLRERAVGLIRTLPREVRAQLVPAAEFASGALAGVKFGEGSFLAVLADRLGSLAGQVISPDSFQPHRLPPHLRMNIRVVDEAGRTLGESRDLTELREQLAGVARDAFRDLPPSPFVRDDLRRWDFGDLPESVPIHKPGITVQGYPAVVEEGNRVHLRLLDAPETAARAIRAGLRRLFMIQLTPEFDRIAQNLRELMSSAAYCERLAATTELQEAMLLAIADEAFFGADASIVRSQVDFADRAAEAWRRLPSAEQKITRITQETLEAHESLLRTLESDRIPTHQPAIRDIQEQVARLIPPNFPILTPPDWLPHLPRFLKAAQWRLRKLESRGSGKDAELAAQVRPFELRYIDLISRRPGLASDPHIVQFRWMIEELRVSLFAQELGTSQPVSPHRLQRLWEAIED
ncbi:MAG: DUF3418 domain-containing protein, partial [Phycisphaerae bacterium]|nr:DUF3418 domain-containing protein [Phycisphaerae bacterium]